MDADPLYRRPAFATVAGGALLVSIYAWALSAAGVARPWLTALLDLALGLAMLLLTIILAAQFVLPVRGWPERRAAVGRMLAYLFGRHGPVLFIANGKAVESHPEPGRRGPGVLLVDPSSAAVLRTETRFTRAAGPGITFTAEGEALAEALDIRRQVRKIQGTPPSSGEPIEARAAGALALTLDGVPVSADISVTFMLDPGHSLPPREGRSAQLPPYEFSPAAAERAVYGHAYGEHDDLPWTELPLRLVIDLFREQVKTLRVAELYGARTAEPSPLFAIQEAILARLAPSAPDPRRAHAKPVPEPSREQQMLASRGTRVLSVNLSGLYLPDAVQAERARLWSQPGTEPRAEPAPTATQREAGLRLCRELTSTLRTRLASGASPERRESLMLVARDAARLAGAAELAAEAGELPVRLTALADELASAPEGRLGRSGLVHP